MLFLFVVFEWFCHIIAHSGDDFPPLLLSVFSLVETIIPRRVVAHSALSLTSLTRRKSSLKHSEGDNLTLILFHCTSASWSISAPSNHTAVFSLFFFFLSGYHSGIYGTVPHLRVVGWLCQAVGFADRGVRKPNNCDGRRKKKKETGEKEKGKLTPESSSEETFGSLEV